MNSGRKIKLEYFVESLKQSNNSVNYWSVIYLQNLIEVWALFFFFSLYLDVPQCNHGSTLLTLPSQNINETYFYFLNFASWFVSSLCWVPIQNNVCLPRSPLGSQSVSSQQLSSSVQDSGSKCTVKQFWLRQVLWPDLGSSGSCDKKCLWLKHMKYSIPVKYFCSNRT